MGVELWWNDADKVKSKLLEAVGPTATFFAKNSAYSDLTALR
jgi:hypothetical protein